MNAFRLVGDMCHLAAVLVLLVTIWRSGSVSGISGKSQLLFGITYLTRYLDLAVYFVSAYNTAMKAVFILASMATCYMVFIKFKASYSKHQDSFRIEFLLIPTVVLALLVNHRFTPLEIAWTFSIYLESLAILPQLFLIHKTGEAEVITSHYLFALGSYRGLYILNWIYRYYTEGFYDVIAIVAGVVQTALYADFFYVYFTKLLKGQQFQLPIQLRFDEDQRAALLHGEVRNANEKEVESVAPYCQEILHL